MGARVKASRAAIYARISDDPEGREAGVQRQVEDCQQLAEQMGWTLSPYLPFIDNDISASTLSKKRRPEYERMMDLVRQGEVDGILFYTNGRLTRRPREYEDVIELHIQTGVLLKSVKSVDADLSTADGRMIARVLAAQDAAEAERISERVKRANVQRRSKGLPEPSSRAFGFEKGGVVIVDEEAALIREAARRIIDDQWSLGMVTRDWNKRGIPTLRGGGHWNSIQVRRALTSPRSAGLLSIGKEVVGTGSFGQIITPEERQQILARLEANRSNKVSFNQKKHWLAGLIVCGLCGKSMKINGLYNEDGTYRKDSFIRCSPSQYGCGKVKRNYIMLLDYMDLIIRKRIELWEPTGDLDEDGDGRDSIVAELRLQLEQVNEDLDELQSAFRSNAIRFRDYHASLAILRDQEEALQSALAEAVTRAEVDLDIDLLDAWENGGLSEKVAIAQHFIDHVKLHPTGRVGPAAVRQMIPQVTEVIYKQG